ncbi:MAG: HAMP domain-containing histidine kinase [Bdellovibrionaceae bacterium]|nr:HAMP domain-containing histidine kinase [Pseudobdellovibrionaceae bacterium]
MLASGLAHEIGTPLGVMRGRAELIQMQADNPKAIRSGLDTIIQQIDRISALVRSLLTLARGDSDGALTEMEASAVVEDVLRLISYEAIKSNVKVLNNLSQPKHIMGSPSALFQVVLNICVNAIQAIQEKKKSAPPEYIGELSVVAEDVGEETQLRISDNGCGIPPENMKKIFSPFFTTKQVGVGTGLGLATALKIVTAWGGYISVSSVVGEGTTFTIHLKRVIKGRPPQPNEQ